jgi:hypothetical protein
MADFFSVSLCCFLDVKVEIGLSSGDIIFSMSENLGKKPRLSLSDSAKLVIADFGIGGS